MQRARVDLPHPVSPTRPRVLPRRTVSDTPSTACTCATARRTRPPPRTGKYFTRLSTRTSTSSSTPGPVTNGSADVSPTGLIMMGLPPAGTTASACCSCDHASFGFGGGGDGAGDLGGALGAAELDGLGALGLGGLGQAGGGGGEPAGGAVLAGVADGQQAGLVGQAAVHHVGAAGVERAAGRQPDQAGRLAGDRAEPLGGGRGARDGLEQALGVGVVGLVEDVALGGLLRGPAGVHDHDLV